MGYSYDQLLSVPSTRLRQYIRQGLYCAHTAGLGRGKLQANLAIMPALNALDFMRFCQRNPKPCPIVGISDTGDARFPLLGNDIDLRTDLPGYNIYRAGRLDQCVNDIADIWQDDFVAFALGCSFTFEHALQRAGIALWHIDNNRTVPMYRSNIETISAGPFDGNMVVSMRAIDKARIEEVITICQQFPLAHGAPIYWGPPDVIGIDDLDQPDWGDPAPCYDGQIPVFWACGVTPQVAIMNAKLPICITHKPGHMLITDVDEHSKTPIIRTTDI